MLRIDRTAEIVTAATPARVRAVLTDVPRYPAWASLIERVDVPAPGGPITLTGRVLGVEIVMTCLVEADDDTIVMRRLPFDGGDDERYVATWTVSPRGTATGVRLRVVAALDAPGPAALLQGRVSRSLVDDLLADAARVL